MPKGKYERTGNKKHEGIKEDILECLNRPSSTFRILLMVRERGRTIVHQTLQKYLKQLVEEGKVNEMPITYGKTKLIVWSKK
jgi:hypothetical protein